MTDKDVTKQLQMRADLSHKIMENINEVPMDVVFDVFAYVVAHCITQSDGVSPSKLLAHFNSRVVDLHRAINTEDDHTLQ